MNKLNFFFICGLLCAATMNLSAQTWNCGFPFAANVTATLDADGTLTISGTGDMANYEYSTSPWLSVSTSIVAVNFTGSITSIGNYAFRNCSNLTSLTIPGNVGKIGDHAFQDCTGLISVTISDGVILIGEQAFYSCTSLSELSMGNTVEEIGFAAFAACNISHVVIPDGVKYIRDKAFDYGAVTHLVIPSSVKEINLYAFGDNPLEEIWVSWHELTDVKVDFYYDSSSIFNDCFSGFDKAIDKSSVILHVPVGTKSDYETHPVWYNFNIVEDGPSYGFLKNLTVSEGKLSPEFNLNTFSYKVAVPQSIESILLTATPFDGEAIVTGDGLKQLTTGENTFEITVVASDGSHVYTVIVTRRTNDLNLEFISSDEIETGVTTVERYNSILGRNEWVPVIDRYELEYVLTTGNFSGNLTLLFDIRGNTYSKEVSVDAYSNYRFFISWRVGNYQLGDISFFTHLDQYGRPDYITTMYSRRLCNVTVSDNNDDLSYESIYMAGNSISEISVSGLTLIEGEVTTSYSVTFDSQGGSAIPTQTIEQGGKVTLPETPVREGYDFAGWFTDNGTFLNEWNFDTDVVMQHLTLYAKWELSTRTVTIESPMVKVFPNPVKDELRIESDGLTIKSVEIFDLSGKTVYQSGNFSNPINVSALARGIYFLRIETEKGIETRKFVKE